MIVCASLIDKAPNLGGLARTCEIFALDKLIVPDLKVKKMDNFKAVSVSAGDWVDIEAVREEVSGIAIIHNHNHNHMMNFYFYQDL
tara:strand:+ start:354 stop:611 length:258 start_codon:yes stop_codon:yes gene_type:complete